VAATTDWHRIGTLPADRLPRSLGEQGIPMTRTIRTIVATATMALAVAAAQPPAQGAATPTTRPTRAGAEAIFYVPTERFLALKRRHVGPYNWTDDGCSVPAFLNVSVPVLRYASSTFVAQCAQHDFAYRNFGGALHLDRSETRRRSVDRYFYAQMRSRCHQRDVVRPHRVTRCLAYARLFYLAVRAFGRL
jgi:hypothetical protein